jgi:uncharacterized protein YkwD
LQPASLAAALALALSAMPAAAQDGAALVTEINRARADPQRYAEELRTYRKLFRGKIVWLPGLPHGLNTSEGPRAVDEAIAFMARQPALPPLAAAPLLAHAAGDHVRDQGASGKTGHIGGDGTTPGARVKRRGGDIYVAESITYGPERVIDVVRQLIIDDGVPRRGHRKMLFDPRWRHAGAACGPHASYRRICVIEYGDTATGAYPTAKP